MLITAATVSPPLPCIIALSRVSRSMARGMLDRGMEIPLTITLRHMPPSAAIEADIREKAAKLEEFYDRITSARVVVETPHRHHRHGKLFHVRIDLRVPGRALVVSREPAAHHAYEDVHVAIRDAFDGAKRQLEDYAREIRGDVKTHEPRPQVASPGSTRKTDPDSSGHRTGAKSVSTGTASSAKTSTG